MNVPALLLAFVELAASPSAQTLGLSKCSGAAPGSTSFTLAGTP